MMLRDLIDRQIGLTTLGRAFLHIDPRDALERDHLPESRAVPWRRIMSVAEHHLGDLLDVDVMTTLVQAWRGADELMEVIHATPPGQSAFVSLARHTIESEHAPSIEVRSDQKPIATLDFRLSVAIDIEDVGLVVRDGRIAALTPGRAKASVSLVWTRATLPGATLSVDHPLLKTRIALSFLEATPGGPVSRATGEIPASPHGKPTRTYPMLHDKTWTAEH